MQKWSRLRHWTVRDVTSQRSEAGAIIAGVQAICTRTTDFDTSAAHMTSRLAVMQRRSAAQNRSLASRVPTTLLHYSGLKTFRCSDATARAVGRSHAMPSCDRRGGDASSEMRLVAACHYIFLSSSAALVGLRLHRGLSARRLAECQLFDCVLPRSSDQHRRRRSCCCCCCCCCRDASATTSGIAGGGAGKRRKLPPPYGRTSKNYVICVCFHCHGTSWYHTTNTLQGRRAKSHVDTQTIQPGLRDFVL